MERNFTPALRKLVILLGAVPLLGAGASMNQKEKVILLGMDGMDPKVLERLAASGDMPNFKKLMDQGSYRKLATIVPSESPVAWSTLATGSNPGKHGIFGFIHRDPKTYLPSLALYGSSAFSVRPARGGTPFWNVSSSEKIPTDVIRFPITFPPEKIRGRMLSGMGVPDLRGTLGQYSFYTADAALYAGLRERGGKGSLFLLESPDSGPYETQIMGPRASGAFGSKPSDVSVPLRITVHPRRVTLETGGQTFSVEEGRWSGWITLRFSLPLLKKVSGVCRFYLAQAEPLKLYLSAVQIDPKDPEFPISEPAGFSAELAERIGGYHTLGMPEDTNAYVEGALSSAVFLEQVETVMAEREKMLGEALKNFSEGLLVFVFDEPDRLQHVFWKEGREKPIDDCYRRLDKVLGGLLAKIDARTTLLLVSDHGFSSFRTNVHLNRWLMDRGYLRLLPGVRDSEALFKGVDWSKTRAYSVGLNGLYVNLEGRESSGIVKPGEARALLRDIEKDLLNFRDAQGHAVVWRVFHSEDIFSGPYREAGPDLLLGMHEGFRISQQTALGGVPGSTLSPNDKKWSGDHVSTDPDLVPGVFLSNRKFKEGPAGLQDIAPTVLTLLGCTVPSSMDGRPLPLLK